MPSGNSMVDAQDAIRVITCPECSGEGTIPWNDVENGVEKMLDKVSFKLYCMRKDGHPVVSFREALRIARGIRKEGKVCDRCDGTGEVEA